MIRISYRPLPLLLAASIACATAAPDPFLAGEAARAEGNYAEALSHYEKALAAEPDNPRYKRAVAEAKTLSGVPEDEEDAPILTSSTAIAAKPSSDGTEAPKENNTALVMRTSDNVDKNPGGKTEVAGAVVGLDDERSAQALRDALRKNPNDAAAKAKVDEIFKAAAEAVEQADDKAAAKHLAKGVIATDVGAELKAELETAIDHLGASRYAAAEKAFGETKRRARKNRVAAEGHTLSNTRRKFAEQTAVKGLEAGGDPRPHAKQLADTRLVEPRSRAISRAIALLMTRAKKAEKDAELAHAIDAIAVLDHDDAEIVVAVSEASAVLEKGDPVAAEDAYRRVGASSRSRAADLGAKIIHDRRLLALRAEYDAAKKAGDALEQSSVLTRILEIEPSDRRAKSAIRTVGRAVVGQRVASAKQQNSSGQPGVAYLYLERALALDAKNREAGAMMKEVTEILTKKPDLQMVVEKLGRTTKLGQSACKGIDGPLRTGIMTVTSAMTNLGGYVLGPGWTEEVEKKTERAPEVNGAIDITLTSCRTTRSSGKLTFDYRILVPRGGTAAVSGTMNAELPKGLLPRDEQDAAGKNAMKALAKRATARFAEQLVEDKPKTRQWLLALAEHGQKKEDASMVAEAYARLRIKNPVSVDKGRLMKITTYLDKKYR